MMKNRSSEDERRGFRCGGGGEGGSGERGTTGVGGVLEFAAMIEEEIGDEELERGTGIGT